MYVNTILYSIFPAPDCPGSAVTPPLISGQTPSPPGLTAFPSMAMPCPARLLGFSFYASSVGSFWVDILRPESESTIYSLVFTLKVTATSEGLHQVSLPYTESYFTSEDDIVGIQDDASFVNSLRYLNLTSQLLLTTGGDSDMNIGPAQHFPSEDDSTNLQHLPVTASTNLSGSVPPILLHLEKGNMCGEREVWPATSHHFLSFLD